MPSRLMVAVTALVIGRAAEDACSTVILGQPQSCQLAASMQALRKRLQAFTANTVAHRGQPWPTDASSSCSDFNRWIAERRRIVQNAGVSEMLSGIHTIQKQAAHSESWNETVGVPPLTAQQTAFIAYSLSPSLNQSRADTFQSAWSEGSPKLRDFFVSRSKLVHDVEQLSWLLVHHRLPHCFWFVVKEDTDMLVQALTSETLGDDDIVPFSTTDFDKVALFYNTLIYRPNLPAIERVIHPSFDFKLARQIYHSSSQNLVVMDNFLSTEALAALLRFSLEATVWHDLKGGFLGAYMQEGFENDVLVRLVEELHAGFPDVIGNVSLEEMWAYKYSQGSDGIHVHADESLVNVNFRIVPDEANLDPTTGGMVVYERNLR
eukprot:TRINITY_DN63019_c0_g1_i1.p1 TRINITY_DN63019_c0_g1~~TRINITY_DN63019_c0_g1_i1.p1  ORF type:complete len:377 (+),score=62.88 TRINITY_DN63019_c0_g1_i1:24-1154(+)